MLRLLPGFPKPLFISLLSSFALLVSCERYSDPQSYFPETGRRAVHQRSLDLTSNLKVLFIALQPGYEDLSGIAYFRLGKGARVMSAYVTNGEAGESDVRGEFPPYLAAARREEASKALSHLDSQVHFLNMPDIVAARDTAKVRESWPAEKLQERLEKVFSQFRPDVVLLARDWAGKGRSHRLDVLYSDLLSTARNSPFVDRLLVDGWRENGFAIPSGERHEGWGKTYRSMGKEAALEYQSLAIQRNMWMDGHEPSYRPAYTTSAGQINEVDDGLPRRPTTRLSWMDNEVRKLSKIASQRKAGEVLTPLVTVLDSVSFYLSGRDNLEIREQETLLRWKRGLERLRCALLGVEVNYSISDTILTDRQLTFLNITEVKGINNNGNTYIYFPGIDEGWIVNEDPAQSQPLKVGEDYRLVTPEGLDYTYPPGRHEVTSSTVGRPFVFFLLHRGSTKEESFVYSTAVEFTFSPKVVLEILPPIVRIVPNERVVVQLMNVSRDGVADMIRVDDVLASSTESTFRMSHKGSSHLDTLHITWRRNPSDGTYLIPLKIGQMQVGNLAARKFNSVVDGSKKIGIVQALPNSPTVDALRRLRVKFSPVRLDWRFLRQINSLNVLIVDRRALSLQPRLGDLKDEMLNFVRKGGHLIVLSQDAESWNEKPLFPRMFLAPTLEYDENTPLELDPMHRLLTFPNRVPSQDWNGWLYSRGHNIVSASMLEGNVEIPVSVEPSGQPLILTMRDGEGRRTYVDLALSHQWMNIHPGAFRLLANLISH